MRLLLHLISSSVCSRNPIYVLLSCRRLDVLPSQLRLWKSTWKTIVKYQFNHIRQRHIIHINMDNTTSPYKTHNILTCQTIKTSSTTKQLQPPPHMHRINKNHNHNQTNTNAKPLILTAHPTSKQRSIQTIHPSHIYINSVPSPNLRTSFPIHLGVFSRSSPLSPSFFLFPFSFFLFPLLLLLTFLFLLFVRSSFFI